MPEPQDYVRIGIIGNFGTVSHFDKLCIENIGFPLLLIGFASKSIVNTM
jgi:hypothetical protein